MKTQPIYICLSLYIGYFWLVSASSVTRNIRISGSLCTVLRLWGTTHEQIPSMQMAHKSKHNNKWMQILAGTRENSSGAKRERELKFGASNKESRKPAAKKHRFAQWRSHQQERLSDYSHVKTAVIAVFFFLPLCIQLNFNEFFLNAEGQINTTSTMRTEPMKGRELQTLRANTANT